jgi:hypothetical protein
MTIPSGHIREYIEELDVKVDPEQFAKYPKDSRLAKAYETALDIRKFEIELYWKRAGYFWLLLAALATSLGLVLTAGNEQLVSAARRETMALFISCAGTVLAICWMIVNRASKTWQRNWELQVDVLEDVVVGPQYKTVMFKGDLNRMPVNFSVSDANFWISAYFCSLFSCCAAYFSGVGRYEEVNSVKIFILGLNAVFIVWLLYSSWTIRDRSKLKVALSYTRRIIQGGKKFEARE